MTITLKPTNILSAAEVGVPLLRGSAATTAWSIAIDWDRNGNFSDTYDDVIDRVISAQWFLGMRQPYQDAADNSILSLTLRNNDRRYSPEYSGSPLAGKIVPFRPIRIQSSDGLKVMHWAGWVESIQPAVNQYGQRFVQILATGSMQFLKAAETALEMQENKRTDEIIDALIGEVVFPPALASAWVLGRVGNSEVGKTTFLADISCYSEFDKGTLTLAMAGDNWVRQGGFSDVKQDTFNVYHAIMDVAAAERGRFFFSREGKALFWNRHHLLQGGDIAAAFDNSMTDMAYTYAGLEQCKNEIIVTCHPRDVSVTDQDILWELKGAVINVEPSEPRTLSIKYKDEDGKRIGAKDVTVGGLQFYMGNATATVEAKASGADLTFTNTGSTTAVVKACVVKGRKIIDSGQMEAKSTDDASIIDYGRRTLQLNLPAIDNLEQAEYIAQFEAHRRGQPRGVVTTLSVLSHGIKGGDHHRYQHGLTLGDKILIEEEQSSHQAEHYIIGELHELTAGATLYKTTWYLEPAPQVYPWKLGVIGRSELGVKTYTTY